MHKKELINGLKKFVSAYKTTEKVCWRGQEAFAKFLVNYLEKLKIPSDEKYDFWEIEPYLPQLMADAFESLRTGSDENTVQFREMYEAETGHEVPNILDLGVSRLLDQSSAIQTTLGFMLREITGQESIKDEIDKYCNAQQHVLQQTFDKFLRLVYRQGMYELADKCSARGMSGKFGNTELRTYIIAGRVMFTFARRKKGKTIFTDSSGKEFHRLPYQEDSVSFVGEDGDPLCLSAGLQSVQADLRTALGLIEDVIKYWPSADKDKKRIFKTDKDVSMI